MINYRSGLSEIKYKIILVSPSLSQVTFRIIIKGNWESNLTDDKYFMAWTEYNILCDLI